ncbi:ABC transporter permease, partial [bacterium]|nr:ABC transporter permease [bacterium]
MSEPAVEIAPSSLEREPLSPGARRARAFLRNRAAVLGLAFVLLLVLAALLAPLVSTHAPSALADQEARQGPSRAHWFGTDGVGRDVYSNVVYGTRVSLPIGLISVSIAAGLGVLVGGIAGWKGGLWDVLLMRSIDVLLAFPSILLALLIVTMLGRGTWKVMVAVGISEIPRFARQMRA